MTVDEWKCPHCGARAREQGSCVRCGRGAEAPVDALLSRPPPQISGARGARPAGPGAKFRRRHAGGTSGPPRVRVAAERGKAPITLPPGKVGGVFRRRSVERDVDRLQTFEWTDDEIVELARRLLGSFEDLYMAPEIPAEKLEGFYRSRGELAAESDRVLVLFEDRLFGGLGDGFALTSQSFHWKNAGELPQRANWDEIDPAALAYQDDTCAVCLEDGEVQLAHKNTAVLAPRLLELIACLAALAQDDE